MKLLKMREWTEGAQIIAGYIIRIVTENMEKSIVDASHARMHK